MFVLRTLAGGLSGQVSWRRRRSTPQAGHVDLAIERHRVDQVADPLPRARRRDERTFATEAVENAKPWIRGVPAKHRLLVRDVNPHPGLMLLTRERHPR